MNKPVAQLELVVTAAKVDTKPIDKAPMRVITSVEPAKKKCALTVPASGGVRAIRRGSSRPLR